MTDKEMLELAAKAAGINVVCFDTERNALKTKGATPSRWNPLTDDGDAMRLAVRLCMHVQIDFEDPDCRRVYVYGSWTTGTQIEEESNGDPCAATRRAITRAAAEIGKEMK